MSRARERIIARVRAAASSRERTPHPGPLLAADRTAGGEDHPAPGSASGMRQDTEAPASDPVSRFVAQFRANGGEPVVLRSEAAARQWLDSLAGEFGGAAVGADLPPGLVPSMPGLPPESAPLGISLALGAAAETGTLLLDSGGGRRSQLLPPVHVVLVRAGDIDRTLGEALSRLRSARGAALPAAIGLHSAPSKSADIGRHLVVGVHGPGRVLAGIIANDEEP